MEENNNIVIKWLENELGSSNEKYIKNGWFDKETIINDSIIDCIKKCTSPRAS